MSTPSQRLQAIDALRGLVILIMMVDHVRETFYLHQQVPDPMLKAGSSTPTNTFVVLPVIRRKNWRARITT
jgi:uncharacterized membrane protein